LSVQCAWKIILIDLRRVRAAGRAGSRDRAAEESGMATAVDAAKASPGNFG